MLTVSNKVLEYIENRLSQEDRDIPYKGPLSRETEGIRKWLDEFGRNTYQTPDNGENSFYVAEYGEEESIEAFTGTGYGISLARQMGEPEVDKEGVDAIDHSKQRRGFRQLYNALPVEDHVFPVGAPENLRSQIDPIMVPDGDGDRIPAKMILRNGECMNAILVSYDEMQDLVSSPEYQEVYESFDHWPDHTPYDKHLEMTEEIAEEDEPDAYVLPHIFREINEHIPATPHTEVVTGLTIPGQFYVKEYDNPALEEPGTGNGRRARVD